MRAMPQPSHAANPFRPALFTFLRDLAANNDRDWFQANQQRYEEQVREPALQFIADFGPHLKAISPHFLAIPKKVGGSLFRIHRDVRFAKDKSPYKTSVGIQFRHARSRDAHAPGYYLHLEPASVFVAAGIWHPDAPSLAAIRRRLQEDPRGWRRAISDRELPAGWGLEGDSLVRPPRGVGPDDPLVEDLKRKDFIAVRRLPQKELLAADFPRRFVTLCRQGSPLVRYLCGAVGVEF
jgi:uncharacterized protein (TIGR02453 family)